MAVQNGQVQAGVGFGMCLLGIFLFGEKKPLGKLLGNRSATFRHLHCNGSEVFGSMLRIYQSYPHPTTSEDRIYTKYTTSSPSSGRGTFGSSKLSQKKATIWWPEGGNHVTFGKVLVDIMAEVQLRCTTQLFVWFHQDVFVASKLSILPEIQVWLVPTDRFGSNPWPRDPNEVSTATTTLGGPEVGEFVGPFDTRVCRMNSWYAFLLNLSFVMWFAIWFCFLSSFSFYVCVCVYVCVLDKLLWVDSPRWWLPSKTVDQYKYYINERWSENIKSGTTNDNKCVHQGSNKENRTNTPTTELSEIRNANLSTPDANNADTTHSASTGPAVDVVFSALFPWKKRKVSRGSGK